jgi:CheY-like chemotaxis protein
MMEIAPAQYETASLINDSVQLNMTRIKEKPIEFEVHVDETVPAKLVGDELRIKQILNNLLSNAFKFTESGKVTLTVVSEPLPDNTIINLVLIVRDTGRGMTGKQMNKLFEEYSRFDDFFGAATEGTGLGLAITHRLTALMNGGIQVESQLGKGSMFAVRLPQRVVDDKILGKNVAEHLRHFRMNYVARNRRGQIIHDSMPYGKVLIVDDVEANLYIGIGLMKPYGLKIETVKSGFEAIDLVGKNKTYDVIFMDHMMPELDGMKTTEMLREMGYSKPIVALTANAVAGQADMFLENGFDDFIPKPIDIRQLDCVLRKFVRDKYPLEAGKVAHGKNASVSIEENNPVSTGTLLSGVSVEGLDIIRGLKRYQGDEGTYLSILRSFTSGLDSILDSIEKFNSEDFNIEDFNSEDFSIEDLNDYIMKVHGVKGAGQDIFAEQIGSLAATLEDAAKDGDISFIISNNPAFVKISRKFVNDVKKVFAEIESDKSKHNKDKIDRNLLEQLLSACQQFNIDNAEAAIAEIDKYQYGSDDELADWLKKKIDMVAFSDIEERLSEILN